MFIFADLFLPQTMEGWSELEDENTVQRAVSYHSANADTYITAASPSSTSTPRSQGPLLTVLAKRPDCCSIPDELHIKRHRSRGQRCFAVHHRCSWAAELTAYVATMDRLWNGSHASWVAYDNGQLWSTAGAEGAVDRGEWEPPTTLTGNGTLTLNVTLWRRMLRRAMRATSRLSSRRLVPVMIAACPKHRAPQPPSTHDGHHDNTAATSGATVSTDLPVEDGAP